MGGAAKPQHPGILSVPRAEPLVPAVPSTEPQQGPCQAASPGPAEITSETAPVSGRETRPGGGCPSKSSSTARARPKQVPAPPHDSAQNGGACSIPSSDMAPAAQAWPCRGVHPHPLAPVPPARCRLELSPESRQNTGYLHQPWLRWRWWDDMAGPRFGGFLESVRCPNPKTPKQNVQYPRRS